MVFLLACFMVSMANSGFAEYLLFFFQGKALPIEQLLNSLLVLFCFDDGLHIQETRREKYRK